jgi:hypothetical protein
MGGLPGHVLAVNDDGCLVVGGFTTSFDAFHEHDVVVAVRIVQELKFRPDTIGNHHHRGTCTELGTNRLFVSVKEIAKGPVDFGKDRTFVTLAHRIDEEVLGRFHVVLNEFFARDTDDGNETNDVRIIHMIG